MSDESEPFDNLSAVEAKSMAQRIAFAPYSFYATVVMRDSGLLEAVSKGEGDVPTLAERCDLSAYATSLLLDFGKHLGLVSESEGVFSLGKVGFFILNDEMTDVHMNLTQDMMYDALPYLSEAFEKEEPAGLKTLGPWDTLYDGLRDLPEPAKTTWHHFDHFHSQRSFDELLPIVFEEPVSAILDVGGNTGLWTRQFLQHDPDVHVHLMDLPSVLADAEETIRDIGEMDRVTFLEQDLREEDVSFPNDMDVIWMCQLLDCFPPDRIVKLLKQARAAMNQDTRLLITELFPDRQELDAASFCLNAISLYFACVANGTSRFYQFETFQELISEAGLKVEFVRDVSSSNHSTICCRNPRN